MTRPLPSIADRRRQASALARTKSRRAFEVRNDAAGSSAVMYIYGAISSWSWGDAVSARSIIKALSELDVDTIDVHVHSPGGDGFEGIAILNAFRNHRATITMHVDGLAASAASFIVQAGDEIVMGRGSQMMIHDASMLTWGNAEQLHSDADWLDKQSQNIAGVYADRAGGTADQWREAMKQESWYTAEEAVAAGLADRVSGKAEETGDDANSTSIPGDDDTDPADFEDSWDLSTIYTYGGRSQAPAPLIPAASLRAGTPRVTNRTGRPEHLVAPPHSRSASAAGSTPPVAPVPGETTQEGNAAVFTDEQLTTMRQELGLPDGADAATILAAMHEALQERAEPDPASQRASVPEGMVLMDHATVEELRAGARDGRAAREQQATENRERLVNAAVRDGRISPARRDSWLNRLSADPDEAQTLAQLEPGLAVPVDERGYGDTITPASPADKGDAAYEAVYGQKGA